MRASIGLLLIALTLIVAGCGGDDGDEAANDGPSSRCEPLPAAAGDFLGSTLASRSSLVGPVAVRSDNVEFAYMVAARVDGEPALWVMNRLDGTGRIYSVNDHAYDVSRMGRSDHLRDPITVDDDGASEALSCVSTS